MSYRIPSYKIKLKVSHDQWYYIFFFLTVLSEAGLASQVLRPLFMKAGPLITALSFLSILFIVGTSRFLSKKQLYTLIPCGLLGALIYLNFGRTFFLYLTILFVYSRGKDPTKLAKILLSIIGTVFLFNIVTTIYFLLFDRGHLFVRFKQRDQVPHIDFSCGGHPNHAARYVNIITIAYIFLNWETISFKKWTWIFALTFLIYVFIGSEALLLVPILFLLWAFRKSAGVQKGVRTFCKYGIIISLVLSLLYFWVSYIPGLKPFAEWLNELSTGRFALGVRALEIYGPSFLGSNAQFGYLMGDLGEYVYADNAYISILIKQGAVCLIALQLLLFFGSKKLDYKSAVITAGLLVYGFVESNILSYMVVFPFLNVACCYFNKTGEVVNIQ